MRRNATASLETWLNNKRRKPLILWGARQVGKTYLIRDIFAEEHFSNTYIYIDFRVENVIRDYCSETVDAGDIINFISVAKNKKIDSSTLLIFDEIQECPAIITALKYFCQDYREIPVIATGSMVRIKLKRMANKRGVRKEEPFLFPVGKINQLTLYPMTFDEFLMNSNRVLYDAVVKGYNNKEPLDRSIHELAMEQVYQTGRGSITVRARWNYLQKENMLDKFVVLEEGFDEEDYGVGGRLEDIALMEAINKALDECKAEGITSKISETWFGEDIIK